MTVVGSSLCVLLFSATIACSPVVHVVQGPDQAIPLRHTRDPWTAAGPRPAGRPWSDRHRDDQPTLLCLAAMMFFMIVWATGASMAVVTTFSMSVSRTITEVDDGQRIRSFAQPSVVR